MPGDRKEPQVIIAHYHSLSLLFSSSFIVIIAVLVIIVHYYHDHSLQPIRYIESQLVREGIETPEGDSTSAAPQPR